ncbi:hypothetical protein [Cellulomonas sp. ATA003]|uniref:hypothetical protein n=1 Tax=Cellulomonas sp. ATA003 TaxID=3073064 RepID=UPI002872B6B9|nr:hypothetical protein [Cellulomonas sp. ATA003]WNB86170.1 hypothetical protein REH70_02520 [Cellulomonas sp. ATA003]
MSAATRAPYRGRAATPTLAGPTFPSVVASEWTKLTSLRSPWWTAAVTVVVTGAITYLSAQASSTDPGFQPTGSVSTGLLLGQIGPLVLGVLVGAGEFRTGAFRTTFTLVPRRLPVLAAQTLAVTVFALVMAVLATATSVLALVPAAASRDLPLELTAGDTPGVLLGMVLFGVGLALLGFSLGALLRRTVPAMLTTLVVVLILPVVLSLASDPLLGGADPSSLAATDEVVGTTAVGWLLAATPGGAAQLMTVPASAGSVPGTPDLGPVGGGLVLAAWVVTTLVAAAVRLRSRDVR